MSYILDALKKAERERQMGSVPNLQTTVAATPAKAGGAYLSLAIFALVLLLCGGLIGWWQPWRSADQPTIQVVTAPLSQPAATLTPIPAAPIPAPAPVPPPVVAVATPVPASAALPAAPVALPVVAPASSKAVEPVPATAPALSEDAPSVEALPADIRQSLPATTVLMHSYSSEPKNRLVIINNKPYHEGDMVAAGLKLEEITSEGMVYRFKGYRFKAGVQ